MCSVHWDTHIHRCIHENLWDINVQCTSCISLWYNNSLLYTWISLEHNCAVYFTVIQKLTSVYLNILETLMCSLSHVSHYDKQTRLYSKYLSIFGPLMCNSTPSVSLWYTNLCLSIIKHTCPLFFTRFTVTHTLRSIYPSILKIMCSVSLWYTRLLLYTWYPSDIIVHCTPCVSLRYTHSSLNNWV